MSIVVGSHYLLGQALFLGHNMLGCSPSIVRIGVSALATFLNVDFFDNDFVNTR